MRVMEAHNMLCQDKVGEAVTQYINANPTEVVPVVTSALSLMPQEDGSNRVVSIMQQASFSQQVCRQVVVNVEPGISEWGEELLVNAPPPVPETTPAVEMDEIEGRLAAALAAHLAGQAKSVQQHQILHDLSGIQKVGNHQQHSDDEQVTPIDSHMRLYNIHPMNEPIEVPIEMDHSNLPTLPSLKRFQIDWLTKNREQIKRDNNCVPLLPSRVQFINSISNNRKSLPHKKRISKRLKRGNATNAQTQVDDSEGNSLNCPEESNTGVEREAINNGSEGDEILFINCPRTEQLLPDTYTPVRPILICQLCNEFFGEEQMKFYHHLKQHYEPQNVTIIIENPVSHHMPIDKQHLPNPCLVDTEEALAELGLTKADLYRHHQMYANNDTLYLNNKMNYATTQVELQNGVSGPKNINQNDEVIICAKCHNNFKSKRLLQAHKCEEMNEFSEPEDLMEGINVIVDTDEIQERHQQQAREEVNQYLPQMAIDANKQWFVRDGCAECGEGRPYHLSNCSLTLKEEVLQRILESEDVEQNNPPSASEAPTANNQVEAIPLTQHEDECNKYYNSKVEPMSVKQDSDSYEDGEKKISESEIASQNKSETKVPTKKNDSDKKKRMFPCLQCDKVYLKKNSLVYHILSHSNIRAHKCKECDKAFFSGNQLKVHERVHTGVKPYSCELCPKRFRQSGDLKYHIASIHHVKKKYACDECGKEFARKYSLNLHSRTHSGEKNYLCSVCNKAFSASSYRNMHMRTHTGLKPHKCEICHKDFRSGGDLRRHTKIHMRQKMLAGVLPNMTTSQPLNAPQAAS